MSRGARVLVADANPAHARQLIDILEQNGYRATGAANDAAALEAARREKPALVVSDRYELCAQLRQDPRLADLPVVIATTLSDPQEVIRALECAVDGFILRPYDAPRLLERIGFVLANSDVRQTAQPGEEIEIVFGGRKHRVAAGRLQVLGLLLSVHDAAMRRHRELDEANREHQQLAQGNEALRQAQGALVQQERLRALGQMASGIAHDINNAISPIALYTEAMLDRETLSERARGYLTTIQQAIDDVGQTVGRMREFYRPREREVHLGDVALNPLAEQVIDLTRARARDLAQQRGITIGIDPVLAPELPTIRGAENEIRDALTNLILNAIDALPRGGRIEVRTRAGSIRDTGGDEACAHLEVVDDGIGMDEETRRRCLEPFFTTKGGRGTGLGLAMVYGTAKRHNAILDIESAAGRGTTIRLTFRGGPAQTAASGRHPALPLGMRSLRVLLVDDDPALLGSLRSALEDEGHKVTTANGGQSGIDAFREAQQSGKVFDIVITDLGMPYVDGHEVVASVRGMSPGTPIILLTGWGQHVGGENERPLAVDRLLGKPPRIRELRSALAELTGRRATDRAG